MMSQEQNDLITRTGRVDPCGKLMRSYWQPAGPWDYKPDGSPKHWIGVHPNPGYYQIDVTGIVEAYRHGIVETGRETQFLFFVALGGPVENAHGVALRIGVVEIVDPVGHGRMGGGLADVGLGGRSRRGADQLDLLARLARLIVSRKCSGVATAMP